MIDTCSLCNKEWQPDSNEEGYVWLCPECRALPTDCDCGSDDICFEWTVADNNGNILWDSFWVVSCNMCEKTTTLHTTAREALEAWDSGERLTPIPGTDHYEEAW